MPASDTFVKDQTPRNQYTANANQTDFDYTFLIFNSEDLIVKETLNPNTSNETTNKLTEGPGKDYTVTNVGSEDGGQIKLTSGADSGTIITIERDMDVERVTDFLRRGSYNAEDINLQLDEIIMMIQELERDIDRALSLAVESTIPDLTLPEPVAGNLLQWNQAEDGLNNITISSLSTDTSKYTESVDFLAGVTKTITHNLSTRNVADVVKNANGTKISGYNIKVVDKDSVDITLSSDLSNATVVIIG